MTRIQQTEEFYRDNGLQSYWEAARIYGRHAITMTPRPVPEQEIPTGASKLGGLPHLPLELPWPRMEVVDLPLGFLCQINLAEVKPFDTDGLLPERGMLYFFYDYSEDGMPWGFDPTDKDGWRVLYYEGPLETLRLAEPPADLEEMGEPLGVAALTFGSRWELPDPFSSFCDALGLEEEIVDRLIDVLDAAREETGLSNKLLGHSENIQAAMEEQCQMLRAGLSAVTEEDYEQAEQEGIRQGFARWRLLLQLDSNEELGMMWGDCGRLYFWIPEEELRRKEFHGVWLVLQCG